MYLIPNNNNKSYFPAYCYTDEDYYDDTFLYLLSF